MQQLSQSLAENLSALDARFGKSADYYAKKIVLYGCPGCIVMFDGMASLDSLWELLLDAAGRQSAFVRLTGAQAYAYILHGSAFPAESAPVQDLPQLVARLTAGMAVLLLEGCSSGIVFSVQGLKFRSVEEPSGEGNLRGSREGFTDLLRVNLSLLRRLVRTDTLDKLAKYIFSNACRITVKWLVHSLRIIACYLVALTHKGISALCSNSIYKCIFFFKAFIMCHKFYYI